MPIVTAAPRLLWCVKCQEKFDPKATRKHKRHFVLDHHPKGTRNDVFTADDPSKIAMMIKRYATGIDGVDRVVGGGFVDGSALILGGTTGVGKSTILGEIIYILCSKLGARVLYGAAEESGPQVAARLSNAGLWHRNIAIVHTSSMEDIERRIVELKPHVVIYDSISRMTSMRAPGAKVGSAMAMKVVTERIIHIAKKTRLHPISIAVAHETKDGDIAGPQEVQHDYDVILHFRRDGSLRELEVEKNRFGPAPERAMFEFKGKRLVEVKDAAARILPTTTGGVGCLLFPSVVGRKSSSLAVESFVSVPKKAGESSTVSVRAQGIADERLHDVIEAIAEHTSVAVKDRSVRAKVRVPTDAGNVVDRGVECALALSLASAAEQLALPSNLAIFGELSPSGRVESDPNCEDRVLTAKAAGARMIIGPIGAPAVDGITYVAVPDLRAIVSWMRANCEIVGTRSEKSCDVNGNRTNDDVSAPDNVSSDVR